MDHPACGFLLGGQSVELFKTQDDGWLQAAEIIGTVRSEEVIGVVWDA